MDVAELRSLGLFSGTDDDRLRELAALGAAVPFAPGDELFVEGRPADFWWVLLGGRIELVRHIGREETLLGTLDVPGRWAGGFRAWNEHGAYLATGRAVSAGRIFRLPASALREWATTYFPLGVHLIEGLFQTARSFESRAREKEALIALGTLAAGLAHEINNPAAAATRSVDALREARELVLGALRRLAEGSLSAEQLTRLDTLRLEIASRPVATDALALADREDSVSEWLADHGVRDWQIAGPLAGAGAGTDWCERAAEVLGPATLEPGLEWVAGSLSMAGLLDELKESTRRISGLVAAVASYAQLDRASVQRTDVTEGLEATLVMLASRIPEGVTVVRDYGPGVPRIEGAVAELNQVWTNLIANAVDAVVDRGTVRVSTRPDQRGGVVVEVGDTGAGMSEETRAHAFDPFFTTKPTGEGTGLGLDIARRIVERHRGEITIDLRPGETVLRVDLPPGGPERR